MTCGTKGGLVSGKKQSIPTGHDVKSVSNNEWREVSRGHSKPVIANIGEGLNFRRYKLMNVTESRFKNRQLHMEDYLQMVSAEQKEYAEVFDYSKITEKSGVITDYWTNNLLDLILRKENLNGAYKQVKRNKGKGGIDGMQVDELLPFLRENQETQIQEIREGKYKPNPVRRVAKKQKASFESWEYLRLSIESFNRQSHRNSRQSLRSNSQRTVLVLDRKEEHTMLLDNAKRM